MQSGIWNHMNSPVIFTFSDENLSAYFGLSLWVSLTDIFGYKRLCLEFPSYYCY